MDGAYAAKPGSHESGEIIMNIEVGKRGDEEREMVGESADVGRGVLVPRDRRYARARKRKEKKQSD